MRRSVLTLGLGLVLACLLSAPPHASASLARRRPLKKTDGDQDGAGSGSGAGSGTGGGSGGAGKEKGKDARAVGSVYR